MENVLRQMLFAERKVWLERLDLIANGDENAVSVELEILQTQKSTVWGDLSYCRRQTVLQAAERGPQSETFKSTVRLIRGLP